MISTKLITPPAWTADASCASIDPAPFFPHKGSNGLEAKRICAACPVVVKCLSWALDYESGLIDGVESQTPHGVFGGLTANERTVVLRERREAMRGAA